VLVEVVQTGRIGERAKVVVPALTRALQDPSAEVRRTAAFGLMDLGPEALSACNALRERLEDADAEVRLMAARALWFIDLEAEEPIRISVAALLHDPQSDTRSKAAYNLELMGAAARSALVALEQATHDRDEKVRRQAEQAFQQIRLNR
jgi:HEAT repeat protein